VRRPEPLEQVVADAQRVGHGGKPGVHGARGWKEAGVDYVEVVDVVRFAVEVERRPFRVGTKSHRAAVVRDAGERNLLADHRPARDEIRGATALHAEAFERPAPA
jgi:hypothetical protein